MTPWVPSYYSQQVDLDYALYITLHQAMRKDIVERRVEAILNVNLHALTRVIRKM